MPLTATLVEVTPYRLQYLIVQSGNPVGNEQLIIPNALGPSPDLRTDARTFRGSPMDVLVSQPIPNGANAIARLYLNGDGLTSVSDIEIMRAHLRITARTVTGNAEGPWSVDTNEGAALDPPSAGFAIILINGPGFAGESAYCDIDFEHTFDR